MDRHGATTDKGNDVRKVYISDSPVIEDPIEYNYVSSDIEEEELDRSGVKPTVLPTKGKQEMPVDSTPPQPGMSEVEELAKEAEYQKELQDRLQKASLDDGQGYDLYIYLFFSKIKECQKFEINHV